MTEPELGALSRLADKNTVSDIQSICRRVVTQHRLKRGKVLTRLN